jgi:hypothetical protein
MRLRFIEVILAIQTHRKERKESVMAKHEENLEFVQQSLVLIQNRVTFSSKELLTLRLMGRRKESLSTLPIWSLSKSMIVTQFD